MCILKLLKCFGRADPITIDALNPVREAREVPITSILHYLKTIEDIGSASMIGDSMRVVVHKDNPIEQLLRMNIEMIGNQVLWVDDNHLMIEQCVLEMFKDHLESRLREASNGNSMGLKSFKSARSSNKILTHVV